MVTRSLHIMVNNEEKEVKIVFNLIDWEGTEKFQLSGLKEANWYTEYDEEERYRCAVVNWMAPTWYIELASLFEMIYTGHEYQELIPGLRNDMYRCCTVEKFILGIAGDRLDDYIDARIRMYDDIIKNEAYTLQKNYEAITHARNYLVGLKTPPQ